MNDTGPDATFVMGLHGLLDRHPWFGRASAEFDLDEDVFSLAVKRAAAYGWSSTALTDEPADNLWDHNDADGDWTQDGQVRQLAWLHSTLPRPVPVPGRSPRARRLPVLPAVTVLSDALRRVGTVRLTGTHALVPLHRAGDARVELAEAADWFALADPSGAASLTVTVSAPAPANLAARAEEIREAALERTYKHMAVERLEPADTETAGLARPLAGLAQAEGLRRALAYRCEVREWSTDVAAWTTEVFVDSVRAVTGLSGPTLVTVSSKVPPASS
ncbi:hypothetical protein [Streptomyces beihaiensis]|uniref:Uncharacterized protein n=1 Tax=Streptomyces beihaiensis TaxID=2984495 RepID=A0ABT3TTV3_9ACTN|nr:hypothetical protein [Streptomyces beihaiensis]MCX3060459.1 hypothetical protein [Streptomyces beihaiensis]